MHVCCRTVLHTVSGHLYLESFLYATKLFALGLLQVQLRRELQRVNWPP